MTALLLLYAGTRILLRLLSVPPLLGKVGPNPLFGFRVSSTLEEPKLWFAVNKFAAKRRIGVGAAVAAAVSYAVPGITVDVYALSCLGVFPIVFVPAIVQNVRYLKSTQGAEGASGGDKREVKLLVASSLDGYIASADGGIDWLFTTKRPRTEAAESRAAVCSCTEPERSEPSDRSPAPRGGP